MKEINTATITLKIVFIVVSILEAKNYPNFLKIFLSKIHRWNKPKLYSKLYETYGPNVVLTPVGLTSLAAMVP